jgi:biopolymer transport protein ExbD
MKLNLPDDKPTLEPNEVSAEKTITLVLDNDKVFYYAGFFNGGFQSTGYSGLRTILSEKKREVVNRFHKNSLTVLIKPSIESKYKNVVNVLDEMVINDISTYVLDDLNKQELDKLKSFK